MLRQRQRRGRGQPQRRPHGRAARRPADQRPRHHGQPPLRLQPRRGDAGEPRDRDRRRRRRPGRRRRVDEPRAVGPAEAREGLPDRLRRRCTRPRSAGAWSTRRCPTSGRSRSASPPRSWPGSTTSAARRRTSSRSAATSSPTQPGRTASTTTGCPGAGTELERDEGIRADTSLEKLAKLKPAFVKDGTVTAGNSSPLNDGAARRLIGATRRARRAEPLARIAGRGVHAVDPDIFGIAPVEAANKALATAGIGWGDVDAGRAQRGLRRPVARLRRRVDGPRPREGQRQRRRDRASGTRSARPARASSARWPTSCKASGGRYGVAALCIGVGQGLAVVLETV